jgi:glycine/D-amino acid oxidase-like deaminating enzyme/nitrite reductase/ring-hydroxylating ferredoxin subunit
MTVANLARAIDQSLWRAATPPRFVGALPTEVDVAIIGGGICGLTAAYLLKKSGKRVAVFERERLGAGDTGNTSAHLTYVTDERISELAKRFGETAAQIVWRGGEVAIDLIESNSGVGIDCGFQRVPGYLCAPFFVNDDAAAARESLRADAELAQKLGFAAHFVERAPPTGKPAIAFADQAIFHPLDYLFGLASAIDGDGSVVREESEVGAAIQDPFTIVANGENVACTDLVIATHTPLVGIRNLLGATLFQSKLYLYSTYVLGGSIDDSSLITALYSDTSNPYSYLRVHENATGRYAIFGGQDHKTGQVSETGERFDRLAQSFQRLVPSVKVERRWSGQVIETSDGLPYIGEVAPHQYIATGFSGNGLTFGTLAGLMIHDEILRRPTPWKHLFDPNRKPHSLGSLERLVKENVEYPLHFIADRLRRRDGSGVENVPRGTGKVLALGGQRVAVHRKDNGDVVKVSAVCTHMGCLVRWNDAERTWDCPCHGSRFTPEGLVIGGPAEAPLEKVE